MQVKPTWILGDALTSIDNAPVCDFILTCPPYGDLEVYSNDPNDLSNMSWQEFSLRMMEIVAKSCSKLKDNSFACYVVSNFRDKKGFYRNLVGLIIDAFSAAGLEFYNDAILANVVGTAALRTRQFVTSRKLVKHHQNVLIFVKGCPKLAAEKLNEAKAST